MIYYLTKFDYVYNIKGFLSYFKNCIYYFMQPIHEINIPLSFVLLNLESVERKQEKYKNLNIYLKNEKSFLDKIKSIFYS